MQFLKVDVASGLSKEIYSRMMLCGQFATGKTTISKIITKAVQQLDRTMLPNDDHNNNGSKAQSTVMTNDKSTIGVDIIPITVNASRFVKENNNINNNNNNNKEISKEDALHLQIWDFAGINSYFSLL